MLHTICSYLGMITVDQNKTQAELIEELTEIVPDVRESLIAWDY